MPGVSGNGDKLLGYAVWHGGKWYMRRRLPSPRATAGAGIAALSVLVVAAPLARRLAH
jgi:hypothetical protein